MPGKRTKQSSFAALFAALAAVLLLWPGTAPAESIPYGKGALQLQNPVGYVDSQSITPNLFQATLNNAALNGELLRIYLPDDMAQHYANGRPDAVTRQVCLFGFSDAEQWTFERKALELLSQMLAASFSSYEVLPATPRRDRPALEQALAKAAASGSPLLVTSLRNDNFDTYLTLLSYPLEGGQHLTQAVSSSLVLVKDSIVFISASSIIRDGAIVDHVRWTRAAAEAFADMLLSANKG